MKRQAALFGAGVGMAKGEPEPEGGAGGIIKALLMLFVNPFATFKMLRRMFKP